MTLKTLQSEARKEFDEELTVYDEDENERLKDFIDYIVEKSYLAGVKKIEEKYAKFIMENFYTENTCELINDFFNRKICKRQKHTSDILDKTEELIEQLDPEEKNKDLRKVYRFIHSNNPNNYCYNVHQDWRDNP